MGLTCFFIYSDDDIGAGAGAGGDGGGEHVPTSSQHCGYEPVGFIGMIRQFALSSDVIAGHLNSKIVILL